jgi:two-component system cell cycle sensor histidine kinase/response regulator CckA
VIGDATDRKPGGQRRRRDRVQQQSHILNSAGAILWRADALTSRFLYVSEEAERLLGYPCRQWLAEPEFWKAHLHPDDREGAVASCREHIRRVEPHTLEYRMVAADGRSVWLRDGVRVIIEGGRATELVGVMVDVTARKEAEQALRDSETRLRETVTELELIGQALRASEGRHRNLFENAPDGILVADSEGRYVDVNLAALAMLGYSRHELIGMMSADILARKESSRVDPALAEINQGIEHRHEWQFRRKDGSKFDADVLATVMADGRILATVRDASERKRLEEQLRQSQKMEAVGRLAGGVAHDFNNSLGVILGYTELLMRQAGEGQRGKLEQILKATKHASVLTRQLLAFSRKQIVDPRVLDLSALLSDVEQMVGRLIGEDIDLAIVPGAHLGQVKADPGQLEQVVINLCVNARDAMPDGGRLRIETANADVESGRATRNEPVPPGRYVMLAVSDTGCGIEEAILSKIFEPFFTTKEEGKGTGLGLAMVYGIVKQAGGYVWVHSEVGRGTTFQVYLPRLDEPIAASGVEETPLPSRGWETILLVEDEGSLRAMAREMLEAHGYRVIEASGPDDAIDTVARHPEPIHLLVTDVVMPRMNGRALAERLRTARPEMRVLYISGYTDDVIAHSGVLESGTLLLEKPFTALALLGRVRAALGDAVLEAHA